MAWEARSGLKHCRVTTRLVTIGVGMAWEARSGLKQWILPSVGCMLTGRNGLGIPFWFETEEGRFCPLSIIIVGMAWEARSGLKHIGLAPGIVRLRVGMAWEARSGLKRSCVQVYRLCDFLASEWPGKPVRV